MRWINTKFSSDIHGSQMMYPNDFDELRFTVVVLGEMSSQLLDGLP